VVPTQVAISLGFLIDVKLWDIMITQVKNWDVPAEKSETHYNEIMHNNIMQKKTEMTQTQ